MNQQSVNEILQRIDNLGGVSADAIKQALQYGTAYYFADGLTGLAFGICSLIASIGCCFAAKRAKKKDEFELYPVFTVSSIALLILSFIVFGISIPSLVSPEWVAIKELIQPKP